MQEIDEYFPYCSGTSEYTQWDKDKTGLDLSE